MNVILAGLFLLLSFVGMIVYLRKFLGREKGNPLAAQLAPYVEAGYFERLEEEARRAAAESEEEHGATLFQRLSFVVGRLVFFQGTQEALAKKISAAGMKWRPAEFLTLKLAAAFLGFVLGMGTLRLWVALLAALVGWKVPDVVLAMKKKKRQRMFQDQLVDTLNLISNSLKAGYSFLQSVEMVSKEAPAPTSEEFGRVVRENSMGMPIDEALEALANRMESPDLDLTVTVVLITREIGGNLAEILENIAGTIRERIRLKGQISALTAQGKMGGVVISALPFGLYFVMHLMNPEVMSMLYKVKPHGYALIVVGLFMQALGIAVIMKMVNIDL